MLSLLPLAIVGLSSGCKNGGNSAAELTSDVSDRYCLRIGLLPTYECLPFYVAEHYGLCDSLGLCLKTSPYMSSMDVDTAFFRGHVDCSVSDLVKCSIIESRGDSVRAIFCSDLDISIVSSKTSRLSDVKNIKEKIFALTRNSVLDLYADNLLSSVKLESIDLNKPQINNLEIRTSMLLQNQYDGAFLPEPWSSIAVAGGCTKISNTHDISDMSDMFCILVHDSLLTHRSCEIKKLIVCYNQAVDYINSHPNQRNDFLSLLSLPNLYPDSLSLPLPHYSHARRIPEASLSKCRQWSLGRGLIEKRKIHSIIDSTLVL